MDVGIYLPTFVNRTPEHLQECYLVRSIDAIRARASPATGMGGSTRSRSVRAVNEPEQLELIAAATADVADRTPT